MFLQPLPRRRVPDPGDVALVGHQPDEAHAVAALDLLRQRARLLGRADRGALRPDLDPPAERPPADVELDADAHRRAARARAGRRRLDQVEMRRRVDHHRGRAVGLGLGQPRERAERGAVGRRVGAHEVLEPLVGEPQALGEREGQKPLEAGVAREDAGEQVAAAHGLRRDPDRLAAGAPEHLVGVRPHRVEVAVRERRLEVAEDRLVAVVGGVESRCGHRLGGGGGRAFTGVGGHGRRLSPPESPVPHRAEPYLQSAAPGEVAERLKALAC